MIWMLGLLVLWLLLFLWLDRSVQPRIDQTTTVQPEAQRIDDVAVIVAFRDESKHLFELLQDMFLSVNPRRNLTLYLVDDHSSDSSVEIILEMKKLAPDHITVVLIHSNGNGKKAALMNGLDYIKAEWVFFTDADCRVPRLHIERLVNLAQQQQRMVVFAPVGIMFTNLFGRLQAIENVNTQGVTESFLAKGKPLMVNGANMLLHSSLINEYRLTQNWNYPGGDDVFFAQSLSPDMYAFAYDHAFTVRTPAVHGFKTFLDQRLRWVSKGLAYKENMHRIFTFSYALLSVFFIYVLVLGLQAGSLFNTALLIWFAKWVVEFYFHHKWAKKYAFNLQMHHHLLLSVIYPFYSIVLGLLSLMPLRFDWKNRQYSNKPATRVQA